MPGTHVASKGVATCNLVIKKKRFQKKPLSARNTRRKQGVAVWILVKKKQSLYETAHARNTHRKQARGGVHSC